MQGRIEHVSWEGRIIPCRLGRIFIFSRKCKKSKSYLVFDWDIYQLIFQSVFCNFSRNFGSHNYMGRCMRWRVNGLYPELNSWTHSPNQLVRFDHLKLLQAALETHCYVNDTLELWWTIMMNWIALKRSHSVYTYTSLPSIRSHSGTRPRPRSVRCSLDLDQHLTATCDRDTPSGKQTTDAHYSTWAIYTGAMNNGKNFTKLLILNRDWTSFVIHFIWKPENN